VTQDTEYIVRNWTAWAARKGLDAAAGHLATFRKALRAGVKIASGTDLTPIADTTFGELEQLVRAGMSEAQAIEAATRTAAELCGAADSVGTVQPGMIADLLAVDGNPLEDIRNLRRTRLVMKEGCVAVLRTPAAAEEGVQ
jgi:imidazolonepropionase-like amidohydrolase